MHLERRVALLIQSVLTTLPLDSDHEQTRTARFDARWVIGNPGSRLFLGPSFLGGVGFHTLAVKEETACAGAEELFQKEQV